MKEEIKPIVKSTHSEKEWQDFLAHRLSVEKESDFLKSAEGDEFLTDAIEGIQSVSNRAHVYSAVSHLNSKVKQRAGGGPIHAKVTHMNFTPIRIMAVAASLCIVIGLGFMVNYFLQRPSVDDPTEIAMNEEEIQTTPVDVAANQIPVNSDAQLAPQSESVEDKNATTTVTTTYKNLPQSRPEVTVEPVTTATTTNNIATPPPVKTPKLAEVKKVNSKMDVAKVKEQPVMNDLASAMAMTENARAQSADEAAGAAPAAAKSVQIAAPARNMPITDYQIAISELEKGNDKKAMESLDKTIDRNQANKVDAQWNKAQLLIKNGEKKAAKKILKELAGGTSPYKERAKAMLGNL